MLKVRGERCFVVQVAYFKEQGGCRVLKCLWIGAKESVKALNALMIQEQTLTLESGEVLALPLHAEPSFVFRRVEGNFCLGGVLLRDELARTVVAEDKHALMDQAFQILAKDCSIPVLRPWMDLLWDALSEVGLIAPLNTLGVAGRAYHLSAPTSTLMEEILLHRIKALRTLTLCE